MVTLKHLHENLIREELEKNYFLYQINEALNTGNNKLAIAAFFKVKNLISKTMPKFKSLKVALSEAENDADNVFTIKDENEASNVIAKLITFYSKFWNFLSEDLPALISFYFRDSLSNEDIADNVSLYDALKIEMGGKEEKTYKKFKNLRSLIYNAFIEDKSPWYRKVLTSITGNDEYIRTVPYLNLNDFADEFMLMNMGALRKLIGNIEEVKSSKPKIESEKDPAKDVEERKTDPTSETEPLTISTNDKLKKIIQFFDEINEGLKLKFPDLNWSSPELRTKILMLVLDGKKIEAIEEELKPSV
jgi:hypothetical protein